LPRWGGGGGTKEKKKIEGNSTEDESEKKRSGGGPPKKNTPYRDIKKRKKKKKKGGKQREREKKIGNFAQTGFFESPNRKIRVGGGPKRKKKHRGFPCTEKRKPKKNPKRGVENQQIREA